jgi:hypothetical protein
MNVQKIMMKTNKEWLRATKPLKKRSRWWLVHHSNAVGSITM